MSMDKASGPSSTAMELDPAYGRLGGLLCGLVALVLIAAVVKSSMSYMGQTIRLQTTSLASASAVPIGTPAPDFVLVDLAGNGVQLTAQKGQVVLVDFWATWCGPCKQELPHIEAFHQKYSDQGLLVLALSSDQEYDLVRPFIDKYNYTFTVLDADAKVEADYGVEGYPTVYLIDRQGRVRFQHIGYGPGNEEKLEEEIKELLAEPVPTSTTEPAMTG